MRVVANGRIVKLVARLFRFLAGHGEIQGVFAGTAGGGDVRLPGRIAAEVVPAVPSVDENTRADIRAQRPQENPPPGEILRKAKRPGQPHPVADTRFPHVWDHDRRPVGGRIRRQGRHIRLRHRQVPPFARHVYPNAGRALGFGQSLHQARQQDQDRHRTRLLHFSLPVWLWCRRCNSGITGHSA